jgi:hypothetical protein
MSAIISEKFRIFNAKQFYESLTEPISDTTDTSSERTRMYSLEGTKFLLELVLLQQLSKLM